MHVLYYYKSKRSRAGGNRPQSRVPQKLVILGLDLGVLDLLIVVAGLICHKNSIVCCAA